MSKPTQKASKTKGLHRGSEKQGIANPRVYEVEPRLYDLGKAADYLDRSVYSMRTLIWNGEIPVVKSGKKMWVDRLDLEAWISKNKKTITA